jgi:hypothetical protein
MVQLSSVPDTFPTHSRQINVIHTAVNVTSHVTATSILSHDRLIPDSIPTRFRFVLDSLPISIPIRHLSERVGNPVDQPHHSNAHGSLCIFTIPFIEFWLKLRHCRRVVIKQSI